MKRTLTDLFLVRLFTAVLLHQANGIRSVKAVISFPVNAGYFAGIVDHGPSQLIPVLCPMLLP